MYKDLPTSSSPSPCRPVATHPSDSKGKTNVPCFRRKAVCHAEWGSFWCTYFNATNISVNLNLFELRPREGEKWRSCWLAGVVHARINAPRSLPPDTNPCKYHFILFYFIFVDQMLGQFTVSYFPLKWHLLGSRIFGTSTFVFDNFIRLCFFFFYRDEDLKKHI
jgi:hypothetical protein